jgi:hypothetical protein
MIKTVYILGILFMTNLVLAGENDQFTGISLNTYKTELIERSLQHVDSVMKAEIKKKSALRAAFYSAMVPGSGELYGGSIWKAAIFTGLEIIGWVTYYTYDSRADDTDSEMRSYADNYWDERKYWSKLYYDARLRGDIYEDPPYEVDENEILVDYNSQVIENLRFLEDELGHTHKLPETKTQQYYEMIYKYLTQFGNAWEDADFNRVYYGNTNTMTPRMFEYRDLRNEMNHLFDIATTVTNAILINHLVSAIDAALTVRGYNRRLHISAKIEKKQYFDEKVNMYGLQISW